MAETGTRKENPYQNLPDRAFWRTGVASSNPLAFSDLYRKKFDIGARDVIASAGSCFAQHIGRRMATSGFNYTDFEPAPHLLADDIARAHGYRMYSARYGNIYTVQQLEQLVDRAFGDFTPAEQVWEDNGRFFDPFRPTIEPNGFASRAEFDALQASHFKAVRELFEKTDMFIFTLGLTEAWVNKADGSVYPICPGTAAGTFDADKYEFRNFTASQIREAFLRFRAKVRAINPGIKFFLTVSPVPLTATASDQHVMVASSYSKSVLRAVAGELAMEDELTDYFPSYEIIAAHPMRAMFFDPNLRTVAPEGVSFVMQHFFAEHTPPQAAKAAKAKPAEEEDDDVVCDEEILETEKLL